MTKKKNTSVIQNNYSSYWMDDLTDVLNVSRDASGIERTVRLASVRRAVANFVRILTNDANIEVKFSAGKESYTNGKTVVISADDDPKYFDSTVGLALHEGSHCALTDFNFLNIINSHTSVLYGALHPTLRQSFKDGNYDVRDHLKLIMNIIEDRRIDSYVYRMAPGYRPYYDAMYEKYFFNTDVEKNMKYNPEWRIPTVDNYINWLLLMFSPHFDSRALPGLKKMVNMIDLPNIRKYDVNRMSDDLSKWKITHTEDSYEIFDYSQFSPLWRTANEVLIEILKYAKKYQNNNGHLSTSTDSETDGEQEMGDEGDLPNLDLGSGKFNSDKGRKALNKMRESVVGKIKKKKLTRNQQKQIESMESASANIEESADPVMGKIPCLVTRKLTKDIMSSDWFPFSYSRLDNNTYFASRDGVTEGIKMGQILTHRLQIRNDPSITHFTRQPHGKIDRRILAQLGMDIESVFKRITVENFRPAMLHLSLDASGSMYGSKWQQVMTVATALAYTSTKIRNLDVVITIRGNVESGTPILSVIFDSRVDTFQKVRTLFPYLRPTGSTPEGLCYPSVMDLIQESVDTHTVFFINFSDGEPSCSYRYNDDQIHYYGHTALKQTKMAIGRMREHGIRIMSYFITENNTPNVNIKNAFVEMYGQDAEFVNIKNSTQVIKTLNKLLLVRG